MKNLRGIVVVTISVLLITSCATSEVVENDSKREITTVKLGYFPNLTHAAALVGVQQGHFKSSLKNIDLTLTPTIFNAGPDAVTALFGNSIDCSYIGPNPTINAYVQSKGEAVRVVAGAASAGSALVVRPGISKAGDLKGKTLATPQLGNTQDVALRTWLLEQGIQSTAEGAGEIFIRPQSNAEGLSAFASGSIDGAWVPQPWVAEFVSAGALVLLNEKELWPNNRFVTANIVCNSEFISQHPEAVEALLMGHLASLDSISKDPESAKESFSLALQAITGSSPKQEVLDEAWKDIEFTYDPLSETLEKSAEDAVYVGFLDQDQIDSAGGLPGKLYDLSILNKILESMGKTKI